MSDTISPFKYEQKDMWTQATFEVYFLFFEALGAQVKTPVLGPKTPNMY